MVRSRGRSVIDTLAKPSMQHCGGRSSVMSGGADAAKASEHVNVKVSSSNVSSRPRSELDIRRDSGLPLVHNNHSDFGSRTGSRL